MLAENFLEKRGFWLERAFGLRFLLNTSLWVGAHINRISLTLKGTPIYNAPTFRRKEKNEKNVSTIK